MSAPVQRSYRTYPFAIPTVHLSTEPPLLIRLKARVVPHPACRLTTGDRPVACRSTSPSLSSSWFWCVRRQICPCGVARFNANPLFIYFLRYFFSERNELIFVGGRAFQLFEFADKYRGKYDSSITVAQKYYRSVSGYNVSPFIFLYFPLGRSILSYD